MSTKIKRDTLEANRLFVITCFKQTRFLYVSGIKLLSLRQYMPV